jgi:hypothetical protein
MTPFGDVGANPATFRIGGELDIIKVITADFSGRLTLHMNLTNVRWFKEIRCAFEAKIIQFRA